MPISIGHTPYIDPLELQSSGASLPLTFGLPYSTRSEQGNQDVSESAFDVLGLQGLPAFTRYIYRLRPLQPKPIGPEAQVHIHPGYPVEGDLSRVTRKWPNLAWVFREYLQGLRA